MQVDASGCMISQSLQLSGVQFSNNTAVLTDDARKILDDVASTLQNQPNVAVQIAGNTDNVGNRAYHLMLSQQRAESVRDRKSVVKGKRVSVRVDLGGRRIHKNKHIQITQTAIASRTQKYKTT